MCVCVCVCVCVCEAYHAAVGQYPAVHLRHNDLSDYYGEMTGKSEGARR